MPGIYKPKTKVESGCPGVRHLTKDQKRMIKRLDKGLKKLIKAFFGHKVHKIDGNLLVAAKVSGVKQKIHFQVASRCSQGISQIKCGQTEHC